MGESDDFALARLRVTGVFFSTALGAEAATDSVLITSAFGAAFFGAGVFLADTSTVGAFAFALGLDVFFSGERAAMVEVSPIMKID